MNNAGVFTLANLSLTAARSLSLITIDGDPDFSGMSSVSIQAYFAYGSGGSTCTAKVVTSFDDGETWQDLAEFDFTTATAVKRANIQANDGKLISSYADLSAEGIIDGILGNKLALYLTTTGTYANTTLSVRASVR